MLPNCASQRHAKKVTSSLLHSASSPSLKPPSPKAAPPEELKPKVVQLEKGQNVCITGLVKASELNGSLGACEEWDDTTGRWSVSLQGQDGRTVAVRQENLCPVSIAVALDSDQKGARSREPVDDDHDAAVHLGEAERMRMQCSRLAVPRRRLLVEQTLEVVRDAFDPAEGLAEAAAAAARDVLVRTEVIQREKSSSLAQPRLLPETPLEERPPVMLRTRMEQLERCDELAKPRAPPSAAAEVAGSGQPSTNPARSVAEQQKRCSELARHRVGIEEMIDDATNAELPALNKAWRSLLAARNVAAPQGLTEAKEWLASRANYFSQPEDQEDTALADSSRPASPRRRESDAAASPEALRGLRELVEELLWVVLLQMRCCPKAEAASSRVLEERLCSLLLSSVGPALRPVARKVLGPGTGLVRRLRAEFPRLCLHLGFRDSEDLEPVPATWNSEEIAARVDQVRNCRDQLLAADLTKALMARLAQ